ncbi:MAG: flagellar biosynthetic protein FliO [Zoogloeaceae bacterium]|jgi:flagellar protein FliO/FliZ|nr:flagellar biosynthetic protein FliO [Zoogloeaceae bacterium]
MTFMRALPSLPFLLLLLFSPLLAAAEGSGSEPGVSSAGFLQMLLALSFIVALLVALAVLGRKFLGGKSFGQGNIRLLGGLALGPRERIVLVEAGEDLLVIGIVPGQIRTLHRMKKYAETAPESAPASGAETDKAPPSFVRAFAQAMRNLRPPHATNDDSNH